MAGFHDTRLLQWVSVAVILSACSMANAASFEELQNLETDFCAVSAIEELGLAKPMPLEAGPRKLEADGGCVECDIKQAIAPSKLGEVERNVVSLSQPILEALQKDQAKRDLAFFRFLGKPIKPIEDSVDQLKNSLGELKAKLPEAQSNYDHKKLVYDTAKKVKAAITSSTGGRPGSASLSADEKSAFFGPFRQELESLVSYTQKRITETEAKVSEAEKASDASTARIYKNYIAMYESQIAEINKKLGAIRALEFSLEPGSKGKLSEPDIEGLRSAVEEKLESVEQTVKSQEEALREIKNKIFSLEKKISVLVSRNAQDPSTDRSKEAKELADYEAHYSGFVTSGVSGKNGGLPCGLTVAEAYAINFYTSSGFSDLNPSIRKGGAARKRTKPFEDVLNSALTKLKAYGGIVKRGGNLPPNVLSEHKEGSVVTYSAFTSTSLGDGFGGAHKFIIKSKKGRYIGPLSVHKGEQEVLFGSDTRFKILSRKDNGSEVEFVLEEVGN